MPTTRPARVAEPVDAEGLNPSGAPAPCGFDSHPGHDLSTVTVGLSGFYARSDDEVDVLAFDRLHQFGVLRVYRVADVEAVGFELVPTFVEVRRPRHWRGGSTLRRGDEPRSRLLIARSSARVGSPAVSQI